MPALPASEAPQPPALDRRRVMRYAFGVAAGVAALPVLAACGPAKPAAATGGSSPASSTAAPTAPVLLPATGTVTWPVRPSYAQPTAPWSMYATKGSGAGMRLEMVTFGNDMAGTSDNFSFFAQQGSGKGTWSVQVGVLSLTGAWAKAGLMIRQSTAADAADFLMVTTVGHGLQSGYRPVSGQKSYNGPTVDALASTPIYMRLEYEPHTQIVLSDSADGQNWTNTRTVPIVAADPKTQQLPKGAPKGAIPDFFPANYYVGVCACSHHPTIQGYAGFTDFGGGFDTSKMQYHSVHQSSANKKNY